MCYTDCGRDRKKNYQTHHQFYSCYLGRRYTQLLPASFYWDRSGRDDCPQGQCLCNRGTDSGCARGVGTGVLTSDLGSAITNRQPVIENIKDALPVTCMLVVMAMAWVIIFTVLIAAISVIRKGGIFDNVMRSICIIGICVPSFWLALILLTAFAVQIPSFSVISDGSFKSLILPSVAMAVSSKLYLPH